MQWLKISLCGLLVTLAGCPSSPKVIEVETATQNTERVIDSRTIEPGDSVDETTEVETETERRKVDSFPVQ